MWICEPGVREGEAGRGVGSAILTAERMELCYAGGCKSKSLGSIGATNLWKHLCTTVAVALGEVVGLSADDQRRSLSIRITNSLNNAFPSPKVHLLRLLPRNPPSTSPTLPPFFPPNSPTNTLQVFHTTAHSFALVNLKPILPGHVLVSPLRRVSRLSDLTPAEVADLFQTVQRVARTLERVYAASALNVAVQDGRGAGQSVPHVHAHVIPRRGGDLDERGGGDAVYGMLEGEEGDVGAHLRERENGAKVEVRRTERFAKVDADEERKPRSEEEMVREAEWLRAEMEKDITARD